MKKLLIVRHLEMLSDKAEKEAARLEELAEKQSEKAEIFFDTLSEKDKDHVYDRGWQ